MLSTVPYTSPFQTFPPGGSHQLTVSFEGVEEITLAGEIFVLLI
jgi:hypothetical protein